MSKKFLDDLGDIDNLDFTPSSCPVEDYEEPSVESYKDLLGRQSKERAQLRRSLSSTSKTYIQGDECSTAVGHVLSTGVDATGALEHTASEHALSVSWVEDVKHNKSFYTEEALKVHIEHEIAQKLSKEGLLSRSDRRNLKNATSVSSMLNQLSFNVGVCNRLTTLENTLEVLQSEVQSLKTLEGSVETMKDTLEVLSQRVGVQDEVEYSKKYLKKRAKRLKLEGKTQVEVAETLNKSLSTIKRWWKTL